MSINKEAILGWFTGKARERAAAALATLDEAASLGYWPPKAARAVRAALNKQAVARKFGDAQDRPRAGNGWSRDIPSEGTRQIAEIAVASDQNPNQPHVGWTVTHAMQFGTVDSAPGLLPAIEELHAAARTDVEYLAVDRARSWCQDFAPVAALMAYLDDQRPKPSYVLGQISETVMRNLCNTVRVSATSATVPEIEWAQVEIEILVGGTPTKIKQWVGTPKWPDGTRHGVSKFGISERGNSCCEACGHAIFNPFNWVPLLLTGDAAPASLWVGRDCAKHLLGAKVAGEGKLVRS